MLPINQNVQQPTANSQPADDQQLNPPLGDVNKDDLIDSPPQAVFIGEPTVSPSPSSSSASVANQPLSGGYNPLSSDSTRDVPQAPINKPPDIGGGLQKEKEMMRNQDEKMIEEIGRELELEKEVKEAGIEQIGEEIVLPEPIKNEGVEVVGPGVQVAVNPPQLPLDDQKIKKALTQKITESLRWLAEWCLKQLKIQKKRT